MFWFWGQLTLRKYIVFISRLRKYVLKFHIYVLTPHTHNTSFILINIIYNRENYTNTPWVCLRLHKNSVAVRPVTFVLLDPPPLNVNKSIVKWCVK